MAQLRDGSGSDDPRLDRLPQFDPRSLGFPIADVVPETLKTKVWGCRARLDQGREGACVEFGWCHELNSYPKYVPLATVRTITTGHHIYWPSQRDDPWPGGSYPGASPRMEGTSVLTAAKVVQAYGFIEAYRWAFNVQDGARAVAHQGPVVCGSGWLDSMFDTRPSGVLDCSGRMAGGHCYLWHGVRLGFTPPGEKKGDYAMIRNSWGKDWGINGSAYIIMSDMESLMQRQGEMCVPMGRKILATADWRS